MAAGGFKEFVAGETLDQDEINDFLMQGVLVFAGTAARGSAITAPVEGQFSYLSDSDSVEFYNGTAWTPFASGLGFATISTTATGNYNDGTYDWDYWDFTSNGSLVITEDGLLDILVVGGGGGGSSANPANASGGGGGVRFGLFEVTAGTVSVTIGAGGVGAGTIGGAGSYSSFGSILQAGGGGGGYGTRNATGPADDGHGGGGSPGGINIDLGGSGNQNGGGAGGLVYGSNEEDGITLNYNNSSIEYGRGGTGTAPTANTGTGGIATNGTGATGRVVVRVRV